MQADYPQPTLRVFDAWPHQAKGYALHFCRPASMLGMEMGTGKSKVAIDLIANEGHRTILVVCPKSVLGVWRREFAKHWPNDDSDVAVLVLDKKHETCKKKAARVRSFLATQHDCTRAVVVNYDSAWRVELGQVLLAAGFDCAVMDESQNIKSHTAKASKWAAKLGKLVRRRLCLTGTPLPHSLLDAFGQYRFLDPSIFGTSFSRFRNMYAVTDRMFPSLVRKWINQGDFNERFHSIAYVCRASEVLDLPDAFHEVRECELTGSAAKTYAALDKDFVAEVAGGLLTASNALPKLLRLQQITSGFVDFKDEDTGREYHEELGSDKEQLLVELLEGIAQPAVVFCRFRHDLSVVRRVTETLGRTYGELSGRRRDLTPHAEMPEGIDVMGVQIQAGGVGVDLTRACYCIDYSMGFSLGDYLQHLARVHRPGQTRPVWFYHLIARGTVDEAVYTALAKRYDVVEYVLNAARGGDPASSEEWEWLKAKQKAA